MSHDPTVCSALTSCIIQAAARILTTRLGLIRTSSRYRDPNTTWRATQTHSIQHLESVSKLLNTHQLLPAVTEAFSHLQCRCSGPGSPGWFLSCWTPSRIRWTYWRSTLTAERTGPREKRGVRIIIHRELGPLFFQNSVRLFCAVLAAPQEKHSVTIHVYSVHVQLATQLWHLLNVLRIYRWLFALEGEHRGTIWD